MSQQAEEMGQLLSSRLISCFSTSSDEVSPNTASTYSSMMFTKPSSRSYIPSLLYSALWCRGWEPASYISFLDWLLLGLYQ